MAVEIYYAPTRQAQRLSLHEITEKLASAGLRCTTEPEGESTFWLVFDLHKSDVLASVEGGTFVFGTLNVHSDDPPGVADAVDQVMQSIGFSADEDAEY